MANRSPLFGNGASTTTQKQVESVIQVESRPPVTLNKYTETVQPGAGFDLEIRQASGVQELACHCLSPPATPAGVCLVCKARGHPLPVTCTLHYIRCRCGTTLCLEHSKESPDKKDKLRLCIACYRRKKNELFFKNVATGFLRFLNTLFIRKES